MFEYKLKVFEGIGLKENKLIKKRKMMNEIGYQYIEIIQQYNKNLENLKTKLTSAIEIMFNANKNWIRELNQKNKIFVFIALLMNQMIILEIDNNICIHFNLIFLIK
ncbi:unnamed protein product [Paramecium pentaurelia]|uniref:Uncharacterized protein n=1 Tax=Paramecium pentaurelia TaxID=43138 RepID=A0A8S1YLH4_9CILI|nr:unnamed protein product [Paramecium pentaurelia]